jgi:hypothetical protein
MLSEEHDLPAVVGIVRDLAIDGLHHRVRLSPYFHFAVEVYVAQRFKGSKDTAPSLIPHFQ